MSQQTYSLVSEKAVENGDRVFSREELEEMDVHILRNYAADANTDAISGRSTKTEIFSYFSRESQPETDKQKHKVLNLYGSQIDAYHNARQVVIDCLGLENPTEGEIVRELSRAYTGWDGSRASD